MAEPRKALSYKTSNLSTMAQSQELGFLNPSINISADIVVLIRYGVGTARRTAYSTALRRTASREKLKIPLAQIFFLIFLLSLVYIPYNASGYSRNNG
jgi:hypothetical protein